MISWVYYEPMDTGGVTISQGIYAVGTANGIYSGFNDDIAFSSGYDVNNSGETQVYQDETHSSTSVSMSGEENTSYADATGGGQAGGTTTFNFYFIEWGWAGNVLTSSSGGGGGGQTYASNASDGGGTTDPPATSTSAGTADPSGFETQNQVGYTTTYDSTLVYTTDSWDEDDESDVVYTSVSTLTCPLVTTTDTTIYLFPSETYTSGTSTFTAGTETSYTDVTTIGTDTTVYSSTIIISYSQAYANYQVQPVTVFLPEAGEVLWYWPTGVSYVGLVTGLQSTTDQFSSSITNWGDVVGPGGTYSASSYAGDSVAQSLHWSGSDYSTSSNSFTSQISNPAGGFETITVTAYSGTTSTNSTINDYGSTFVPTGAGVANANMSPASTIYGIGQSGLTMVDFLPASTVPFIYYGPIASSTCQKTGYVEVYLTTTIDYANVEGVNTTYITPGNTSQYFVAADYSVNLGYPSVGISYNQLTVASPYPNIGYRMTPTSPLQSIIGIGTDLISSWGAAASVLETILTPFPIARTWEDSNSLSYTGSWDGSTISITTANGGGSGSHVAVWTAAGDVTQTLFSTKVQDYTGIVRLDSGQYAGPEITGPRSVYMGVGFYENSAGTFYVSDYSTSTLSTDDFIRVLPCVVVGPAVGGGPQVLVFTQYQP